MALGTCLVNLDFVKECCQDFSISSRTVVKWGGYEEGVQLLINLPSCRIIRCKGRIATWRLMKEQLFIRTAYSLIESLSEGVSYGFASS